MSQLNLWSMARTGDLGPLLKQQKASLAIKMSRMAAERLLARLSKTTTDRIKDFGKNILNIGTSVKKFAAKKSVQNIQKFAKGMMMVGKFMLDTLGVFMQIVGKMGVMQPLLDIFGGIMNIIGGYALEAMGPALQDFADVLFSDDMMDIWEILGTAIGDFLSVIMGLLVGLMQNPEFIKVMKRFVESIRGIFIAIGAILGAFFYLLSTMSAAQMGALFYGLALMFAFMKGMATGGPAGVVLGAIYAGIVAVALLPLLALQHGGITTGPTLAMIGDNPSGREAIIPLDSDEGGSILGNQEILWATEDNGKKLDRLIGTMETANRIKRLKYL